MLSAVVSVLASVGMVLCYAFVIKRALRWWVSGSNFSWSLRGHKRGAKRLALPRSGREVVRCRCEDHEWNLYTAGEDYGWQAGYDR